MLLDQAICHEHESRRQPAIAPNGRRVRTRTEQDDNLSDTGKPDVHMRRWVLAWRCIDPKRDAAEPQNDRHL